MPPPRKGVAVRPATPDDLPFIAAMIADLASFEKLSHAVDATLDDYRTTLFAENPKVFCTVAEKDGVQGGIAIWFYNYSTFRGRHGLYIEDIYVKPALRSHGLGSALFRSLAERCVAEALPRMDWSVLDWNAPAIDFYRNKGAELLDDWTTCRLTGDALSDLAGSDPVGSDPGRAG